MSAQEEASKKDEERKEDLHHAPSLGLEVDPRGKAPSYDPQHPHYDLNGYIPRSHFLIVKGWRLENPLLTTSTTRRSHGKQRMPSLHEFFLGRMMMDMHVISTRCKMSS
jgi:hypothetical protein